MKKFKYSKPMRVEDASFDELFDDSSNWQLKAERLLQRRERQMRNQMMHY
jgi:hypothetical protein